MPSRTHYRDVINVICLDMQTMYLVDGVFSNTIPGFDEDDVGIVSEMFVCFLSVFFEHFTPSFYKPLDGNSLHYKY